MSGVGLGRSPGTAGFFQGGANVVDPSSGASQSLSPGHPSLALCFQGLTPLANDCRLSGLEDGILGYTTSAKVFSMRRK